MVFLIAIPLAAALFWAANRVFPDWDLSKARERMQARAAERGGGKRN